MTFGHYFYPFGPVVHFPFADSGDDADIGIEGNMVIFAHIQNYHLIKIKL